MTRRRRPVDEAAAWIAKEHPEAVGGFPSEDTGRDHREVSLEETDEFDVLVYWERNPLSRPGVHCNQAEPRNQAIASQMDEVFRRSAGQPCLNCYDKPIRYSSIGHCVACYRYARRHDGRDRPVR